MMVYRRLNWMGLFCISLFIYAFAFTFSNILHCTETPDPNTETVRSTVLREEKKDNVDEGIQTAAPIVKPKSTELIQLGCYSGSLMPLLAELPAFNLEKIKVIGKQRSQTNFMTIGVPSIQRQNDVDYLMTTLQSLVNGTSPDEQMGVVVVVFLADCDSQYNDRQTNAIVRKFPKQITSGFIQIVQAPRDYYPDMSNLKRKFNDSDARIRWRSKQVMDFIFLFQYSQRLSQYYLQLEDDIVCASNFLLEIKRYMILIQKPWTVLEFSELGFIGKLFKNEDLDKLAKFMMIFFDEQPVDWLLVFFRRSMGQLKPILRKPTLFQHVGTTSSLGGENKVQQLQDRYFVTDNTNINDLEGDFVDELIMEKWKRNIEERKGLVPDGNSDGQNELILSNR